MLSCDITCHLVVGWFASEHVKINLMIKKRHHYIPRAYLKFFCDEKGKVRVYLKDNPDKFIHQSPDNTGFHKYYYSQPLPKSGKDHNTLENLFSELEDKWPPIVERLCQRENVNDSLEDIFNFIALQRVRVPASRDACERMRAELVKATAHLMDAMGKLPPKPKGFEDILNHVEVSIDPHQSIHAMVDMIRGTGRVFDQIGIGALHNMTDTPFLTSDNPVIWFDPSVSEAEMRPYVLQAGEPVVLLFPISPSLMIYGHTSMREQFSYGGFGHSELSKLESVETMNRQICRFAYKAVFAQRAGQEALIKEHAHLSPVLLTKTLSVEKRKVVFFENVFGKRERKPKWVD